MNARRISAEAAKLGGYAAAAATAAPALQALAGVPVWIGVALVVTIAMVAVTVLLKRFSGSGRRGERSSGK